MPFLGRKMSLFALFETFKFFPTTETFPRGGTGHRDNSWRRASEEHYRLADTKCFIKNSCSDNFYKNEGNYLHYFFVIFVYLNMLIKYINLN